MRVLQPVQVENVERRSFLTWRAMAADGALVFELPQAPAPFVGIFLQVAGGGAAPQVAFDHGAGFDEVTALSFRAFPFGFYHIALASFGVVRRVRFRARRDPGPFRCLVFQASRPIPVAVLHYLFNLRYQKIGLLAPAPGGMRGRWAASNYRRIRNFFATISTGGGLRVQQTDDDVLDRVRKQQTLLARPVGDAMRRQLASRSAAPLISFVGPVYNTAPDYLRELVASFAVEAAPYAELILVDDGSTSPATAAALEAAEARPGVRVLALPRNGGIAAATNAGIAEARGDWVSFIDHDDIFAAGAIAVIAAAIISNPDARFFYTDEIIANTALQPVGSFCKPAFDPVLLSGMNYINHFSVYRRDHLDSIHGLALDCEGSQDYDLLLRYLSGTSPESVVHIPYLAYVWRRGEASYSALFRERSVGNARGALARAYAAKGRRVGVEAAAGNPDLHRVRFERTDRPLVSVIIPNRDSPTLITRLIDDLRQRTDYPDLEIVVVDNGTTHPDVLRLYEANAGERFNVDVREEPFNFAGMCNRGSRLARGEAFLFLNNDVEVIEPDWLAEMVECLAFEGTGIVGARLLYPDDRIQHAGVIVGLGAAAGHWYINDKIDEPGPMGRLAVRQTLSAVTGACMLVTRSCFAATGGFDEEAFPIAYNDVDFCLRARSLGYRTVWTPFATLYHHESASRGSDDVGVNNERFKREFGRLQQRHATEAYVDSSYSPFYDRRYSRPHLVMPPDLPNPRRNDFSA